MATTDFVSYKFVDSKGNLRDKVISPSRKSKIKAATLEPTWFDGSSFGFTETSKSDLLLVPDMSSVHYDPIRQMDSVFCFLHTPEGEPLNTDFRTMTRRAQAKDVQTRGALFGVEPEFFVFSMAKEGKFVPYDMPDEWTAEGVTQYQWYGSLPPTDNMQHIRHEIMQNLNTADLEVESCHHEVAPGQAELSWRCDSLLRTADKMLLAKYLVQATVAQFRDSYGRRVLATFTPKPFRGLNGNGCHVHQSIPAMAGNKEVLEAYCQGLVDHYDELTAVCNVHEESHERLTPGFEAPTRENNGYGFCDRTKTIRIPADGGRLEYRLPDPMMNPYVALPLMLQYGRESVKNNVGI